MPLSHSWKVTRAGASAYQWLQDAAAQASPAVLVRGVTSRGVFLELAGGRMVFLSVEVEAGPLTINMAPEFDLRLLVGSQSASLKNDRLVFFPGGLSVDLAPATVWRCPPPPASLQGPEALQMHLRRVAQQVLESGPRGLSYLLPGLLTLDFPLAAALENAAANGAGLALTALRQALLSSGQGLDGSVRAWLGRGSGLTPSGDDLLLGLMLAMQRTKRHLSFPTPLENLAPVILRAATEAPALTTTLSANLLACAAQGEADERLITALDGILTGEPAPQQCASRLLAWGNSSGCDALVGMALALTLA